MAARTHKPLVIAQSAEDLLAQDRHTDWEVAQEQGRNRNGRAYLGHRVHGVAKTKQGRAARACRGKVAY
jgi:hypothetical protein